MPRIRRRALLLTALLIGVLASPASAYVYWANGSGATASIARANNDGTGVNLHFVDTGLSIGSIAVNKFAVYWTTPSTKAIGKAAIDGTGVTPAFLPNEAGATLAANDDGLFFTNLIPSTNAYRVSFARNDGMITGRDLIDENPSISNSSLAVSPNFIYRQRIQSGSIASIGRAKLDGADDTTIPLQPAGRGVTYNLLVANADNLFGVRASADDSTYPITVAKPEADAFASLVPGTGRRKNGLALAGCQLFWSSAAAAATTYSAAIPASIGRAGYDGSGATDPFISGTGIAPGAVAADLLPAVDSGCSTTPPPTATPTPVVTPVPLPKLTPEQLQALLEKSSQPDPVKDDDSAWWDTPVGDLDPWGKYDTTDAERAASATFIQWAYCLHLVLDTADDLGAAQGCTASSRGRAASRGAMMARLAKGKTVNLGSVTAGSMTPPATPPTYAEADATLTTINALRSTVRKQSRPIDKARAAVKKAKGAKRKAAQKKLKKLIRKRAPTIKQLEALGVHPIAVKRTKAIRKGLKLATQRLVKRKPITLFQTITLTDPVTGVSVNKVRKLKLVRAKH